jgi:hypothetical protein
MMQYLSNCPTSYNISFYRSPHNKLQFLEKRKHGDSGQGKAPEYYRSVIHHSISRTKDKIHQLETLDEKRKNFKSITLCKKQPLLCPTIELM